MRCKPPFQSNELHNGGNVGLMKVQKQTLWTWCAEICEI